MRQRAVHTNNAMCAQIQNSQVTHREALVTSSFPKAGLKQKGCWTQDVLLVWANQLLGWFWTLEICCLTVHLKMYCFK